ncbi:MAG: SIMPL domain-containing protein [Acidiphilium sp.]
MERKHIDPILILALVLLPSGAMAAAPHGHAPTMTLSASGHAARPPDETRAVLEADAHGASASAAQASVNRTMAAALGSAGKIAGLRATTGNYSVTPVDAKQSAWTARQTLTLRYEAAPDAAAAAPVRALIGQLQARGMLLQSLDGALSRKAERAARRQAIADAAAELHDEAAALATALDERAGPIRSVQLNAAPIWPVRPMMFAAKAAPAPSAQPAPIETSVNLSATIALLPAR